ncbi:FlgD immunoglobulin-like domain containing protein [Achromobacter xylosoxidans]|uniref:FlgD immunoglobulin-like domain containing protein n=1 Tax=Alcaligenes xylosoxydans xylosoxydans TaxID=85698 RepID=UPI000B48D5B8
MDQKTGVYTLNWDGKNDGGVALEPGAYTVSVLATDAKKKTPARARFLKSSR